MDEIDRIRAFNRAWTPHIGALSRSYLDSGLGLAEVRVLHDLAEPGPHRARALAESLKMDEGQISRIIAGFATKGWLQRMPDPDDARARILALSVAGRGQAEALKAASRSALQATLAQMPVQARAQLVAALTAAQQALCDQRQPDTPPQAEIRPLGPGDAGWVISRHAEIYAAEEQFDASFEALVAEIVAGFLRAHDPLREAGWLAWQGQQRLGSIFCVAQGVNEPETAKLRLFLLEKSARGTGLAQRMIDHCMNFARQAGYRKMRLWTHESHRAAGRLYARNAFRLIASAPTHEFGQYLVDQTWEREL